MSDLGGWFIVYVVKKKFRLFFWRLNSIPDMGPEDLTLKEIDKTYSRKLAIAFFPFYNQEDNG